MNYKERLLIEYKELVEKRTLLERTIKSDEPMKIEEEIYKLLEKQLDAMYKYEEILFKRILLM